MPFRRIPLPRSFFAAQSAARSSLPSLTQPRTALSSQPAPQPQPALQILTRQRAFSSTPKTTSASHDSHGEDHHESHYDEPGGWLWGIRPGEKYEYEGWEYLMFYGFTGSWIVAIILYVNREDTS
jgi:hypothetical protein